MIKHAKFCVVHRNLGQYPVQDMCRILECSSSGFYAWRKRQGRDDPDDAVAELISACQKQNWSTYGYRRVTIWLKREAGIIMNHKHVLRIMTKFGMLSEIRRRRRYKAHKEKAYKADNLLARAFDAEDRNEKWVTDISYIRTERELCYLSAIEDLHGGFVVAHKLGRKNDMGIVSDTLKMAKEEAAAGLLLHSDQGSQYTSTAYFALTQEYGIQPSMSKPGTPYDNAPMESFFGTLKVECLYRQQISSFEEAERIIDDYIHFYNYIRIRGKNQMTPFETRSILSEGVPFLERSPRRNYNAAWIPRHQAESLETK